MHKDFILENYTAINARAIDKWAEKGWEWSIPVSREVYADALAGKWDIVLTPTKPVPHNWFLPFLKDGRLDGVSLLGLASGGGQQMPIMAALGADCTVLDYSDRQLESERRVAEREKYAIKIVKADMTKRLPFDDRSFDIIVHPVANCYVENVRHVWDECHRVLRAGGILLSGLDNGFNFMFDNYERPLVITQKFPYNPLRNPEQLKKELENKDESIQFSHTFEEQIGGQLKAGFLITAAYEDLDNDADAIEDGIPAYWATKAVKPPEEVNKWLKTL
jgi:SAM-dependent methyltransferase